MGITNRRSAMALAVAAVGFGPAANSWASGFQLRENSASALGNAFAGAAASPEDASIIANNPAGMTGLVGNQFSSDIAIIIPSSVFSGTGFTAAQQPISGGNGGDAGSAQPVPAEYMFYDASPDLKFGMALTFPFGLQTQYNSNWVGRYEAIKSEIATTDINPAVAYRVLPWLSIGGGLAIQHTHAELSNAINSTTVARLANPRLPARFTLPDGYVDVNGDSWSLGYTLGGFVEPAPGTRLGVSYRSQVSHRIDAAATFAMPAPLSASPLFQNTPVTADLKTPDIVTLSGAYDLSPEITLLAEAQWTNWSVIKDLRIQRPDGSALSQQPENWHSTWFGSVGANWRPDPDWTLRGGFAFDATPISDQYLTASLPDSNRYWLAAGVGYRYTEALRFDAAYTHIFMSNPSINQLSSTGDLLTGRYSNHIDIVALSATLRF